MAVNHQKMLARALEHYHAGQAGEADAACRALLTRWPRDVDALNLRAVIACRSSRFADGVTLLERLLKQQPGNVQALTTLGDARHALGDRAGSIDAFARAVKVAPRSAVLQSRLGTALLEANRTAEAAAAYLQSIRLDGGLAQSHFNHGVALQQLDRAAEAATAYRTAITLDPRYVAAHLNLANVLLSQGNLAEAEATLGRALGCDAGCAMAYAARGALRREQGRLDDAASDCERAIRLQPDLAAAYMTLGGTKLDLNQPGDALAVYRQAIALTPNDARLHSHLGVALIRLDRIDEAADACRAAVALQPLYAPAHTNYGVALQRLDRAKDAIAAHEMAIALDPAFPKAWSNLAESLKDEGRIDEALKASCRAVSFPSHEPIQRFNYALALLMEGDYDAGWRAFESRRLAGVLAPHERRFAVPEWRGESLHGQTLLLHAEQGLGDTLHFVRFVQALSVPGVSIVVECQKPLIGLLQASLGAVRVVAQGEPLPPFDLHLPLMSLPHVLGTRLDTVPASVPYLAADPHKAARWRARIGGSADIAVGVVWSGNPEHKSDARRSLAAASVLPELAMPGIRLFSLQKDVRAGDIPLLHAMAGHVTDLAPQFADFTDTAAALQALDLVIAVDTAVAHLAGALGRPVWMMTPYALDWRWLRDRENSPWYPTMRLFRQSRPQIWGDVIVRIRAGLAQLVAERDSPGQPGREDAARPGARQPEAIF
jgi:tetratricopeptide (TPR) repeat protein